MRGHDEDSGEFHSPSRSAQRRAALDVLVLGERLAELSDGQLAKLPIPEDLLPHIREVRRMPAHGARKRQLAFLAKQMRREEDAALDAIRAALDAEAAPSRRQTAQLHALEDWRERLLEDGDEALAEFIAAYPQADCQRLRQLARNALEERKRNKPPRAFRELFRELRDAVHGDREVDADHSDAAPEHGTIED